VDEDGDDGSVFTSLLLEVVVVVVDDSFVT
jgi:hypothetical protein